jgi:hypothetical protein
MYFLHFYESKNIKIKKQKKDGKRKEIVDSSFKALSSKSVPIV